MMTEAVALINAFSVPVEESERFLDSWRERAQMMAGRPGLIRARMYRALAAEAELRFVNVAEWESQAALDAATADTAWRASVQRMLDDPHLHVVARPAIYELAVEIQADRSFDLVNRRAGAR